jgi:hypothetical protein
VVRVAVALGCAAALELAGCKVVPVVRPGETITGAGMQFRVPAGTGWHKYQDDADGIYVVKLGPAPNETRSAGVHFDWLPSVSGPDAFLKFARESVIKDGVLDQFRERHLDFQLRSDRGYPCVLLHLSGIEQHHTGLLTAPVMRHAQVVSLLCQNPVSQANSFAAVFEHYAETEVTGIDEEAAAFIDSVRPIVADSAAPQRP